MRNEKTSSTKTNGPGNPGWRRSVYRASRSLHSIKSTRGVLTCARLKAATRITAFLIDTPAIRNGCNSLETNDAYTF